MKKILGLVVLSLFAINASAADLLASSAAPTVTQNIVVEGAACPGVGATGFSSTGLLLSCQSGVWQTNSSSVQAGGVCMTYFYGFWDSANNVWGGAACNNAAHRRLICPIGTTKRLTFTISNSGYGGEGGFCI